MGMRRSAHLLYAVGAVGIIVGKTGISHPSYSSILWDGHAFREISSIRFVQASCDHAERLLSVTVTIIADNPARFNDF